MADNITILAQARANWFGSLSEEDRAKMNEHLEWKRDNPEEYLQEFF